MFRFNFTAAVLCPLFAIFAAPASAGLIITPAFGRTIAADTNSANIEATINTVIGQYESDFLNPIHVYITFEETGTGLGQSVFPLYTASYNSFRNGLAAGGTSTDDATALAHLATGANNPVTGTPTILIKSANAKALGFSPISDGVSDGTISFNASITNPGLNGVAGPYTLETVLAHEIDEILGLGSTLGVETSPPYSNDPSPEDFFRYGSTGARSFTTAASELSYFSLDGTTDLAQFDNSGTGDYADWMTGAASVQVQDSFATPGSNPTPGVELQALDVIGYTRSVVPEPVSLFLAASGLAFIIAARSTRYF
ncbi:MAG: NF038122 family metalloprotease [Acidobacteriota bacterium]|nr:NF038122 family metalloprotease [Acidobacteriota bacterium]